MINQLINQFYYVFAKPKSEEAENKYSPKYIVRLLTEKDPNGKAFFYFRDRSDYITLSSNGQFNVRGEEEMFRAWGSSEFKSLRPQSVFEELEREIVEIKVISVSYRSNYSFNSYSEFINWLARKSKGNQA